MVINLENENKSLLFDIKHLHISGNFIFPGNVKVMVRLLSEGNYFEVNYLIPINSLNGRILATLV